MKKYIVLIRFKTLDAFGAEERTWAEYNSLDLALGAFHASSASFVVNEVKLIENGTVLRHFGAF